MPHSTIKKTGDARPSPGERTPPVIIRAIHLVYVAAATMVSFAPRIRRTRFQRIEAWHRRTRAQLGGVVRWLEGGDVSGWDEQIEVAERCLADIAKMARPLPTPKRKGLAPSPAYSPVAANMIAAKPHAKAMLDAMREGRRAAAVESGRAAVAKM